MEVDGSGWERKYYKRLDDLQLTTAQFGILLICCTIVDGCTGGVRLTVAGATPGQGVAR